ncbi:MAG: carbonate dehydratase [Synoicihabitans sp.]
MQRFERLFSQNREWAETATRNDPDFFNRLVGQQHPDFLWIGCSDSRVPANQIVGLEPGEVFVHRNIANVVDPDDINCASVIQFAIDHLKVEHILVVGHYGCGGVRAALNGTPLGLADQWLKRVDTVKQNHRECLRVLPDEAARHDRLCELNVIEQVQHLCNMKTVQDAWARGQLIMVHGCIYHLSNGLLQDLAVNICGPDEVEPRCREAYKKIECGEVPNA